MFPSVSSRVSSNVLDLVHSDLLGKVRPKSIGGAQYIMVLIDDYSKFCVVLFLKKKTETFQAFLSYKKQVELMHNRKIRKFQSDNGTEYVNEHFQDLFDAEGIIHRKIVVGCSQQNGVAERHNRTIVEMSRCLLIESGLPEYFWAEAANTACYIRNLCVNSSIDNQIPISLWNCDVDVNQLLGRLRIFGCRVWSLIDKSKRTKFGPKAEECIFLGYGDSYGVEIKGYKVYSLGSKKMMFKHHVIFDEEVFPFKLDVPRHYLDLNFEGSDDDVDVMDCDSMSDISDVLTMSDIFPSHVAPVEVLSNPVEVLPNSVDVLSNSDDVLANDVLPSNTVEPNEFLNDHEIVSDVSDVHVENVETMDSNLRRSSRVPKPKTCTCCNFVVAKCSLVDHDTPESVCEALNGPYQNQWLEAMKDEINSLKSQNVWSIVPKPSNQNITGCRWVLRIKRNPDKSINKFKARLVAQGFSQIPGVDFNETYCPVVKRRTLRLLMAICVENDWDLQFLDVEGAYLNSILNEVVYMKQPPYFEQGLNDMFVCKLNKSLYGLKQGGRDWYNHINSIMLELEFVRCRSDTCTYVAFNGRLIVCWYVDDSCACGEQQYVQWFITKLSNLLKVKSLGSSSKYLSVQITRGPNYVTFSQQHYILDIASKYGLSAEKGITSPYRIRKRDYITASDSFNVKLYQEAIGSLLYLSNNSRPDLCYTVSMLSQSCSKPSLDDWSDVVHVIKYLVNTKDLKLVFRPTGEPLLVFCDSDYAGDVSDSKSRSAYVVLLANCSISWHSKKQGGVALSTHEAEFVSMCEVAKEVLWLKHFLEELCLSKFIDVPCKVYCDNQSAISSSSKINENISERTKHIATRFNFCREVQSAGIIKYCYVPSAKNLADVFTKAFKNSKNVSLLKHLGLTNLGEVLV